MTILRMTEDEYAAHTRGGTTGELESSRTAASDTGRHDGGPAFPQNDAAVNRINNEAGMSLRDYFAAEALSKMTVNMSQPDNPAQERKEMATAARMAYGMADALLAERDKGKA